MTTESLKFYSLLAGFSIILFIIGFILWVILVMVFKGFDNNKDKKTKFWPFIPLIILFLLLTPTTFYFIRLFDFNIPIKKLESTNEKDNNKELLDLTKQAEIIKKALVNPQNLTLLQIETLLNNSLAYSNKIQFVLYKNDSIIKQLKFEIEIERKHAEESKQLAERIKSLTKEQIESVKFILTEDAKEASRRSFIYGLIYSLPIGILASLFASFVYRRWGATTKNNLQKKIIEEIDKKSA